VRSVRKPSINIEYHFQKSYTVDFLTKKKKWNEGEIPQYYVENSHEAIIEPVVFEMVQREIARRKPGKGRHSGVSMFASRIRCGQCGRWYGSKVWHSNSKYRRTIWQCNEKFKGEDKCATPHLDEEAIKRLFVSAVNTLLADKDEIIANLKAVRGELFATDALEAAEKELQGEMAVTAELIQKCIEENARVALNQKEYQERYEALVGRFDKAKARYEETTALASETKARGETVDSFIAELARQDRLLAEFDERLWHTLVDYATVYSENDVRFTFKDGTEIQA
jgi:FtsZ-binding cell division protein ZapB